MNYLVFSKENFGHIIEVGPAYRQHHERILGVLLDGITDWRLLCHGEFFADYPREPLTVWLSPKIIDNVWSNQAWETMGPELGQLLYRSWHIIEPWRVDGAISLRENFERRWGADEVVAFKENFERRWGPLLV